METGGNVVFALFTEIWSLLPLWCPVWRCNDSARLRWCMARQVSTGCYNAASAWIFWKWPLVLSSTAHPDEPLTKLRDTQSPPFPVHITCEQYQTDHHLMRSRPVVMASAHRARLIFAPGSKSRLSIEPFAWDWVQYLPRRRSKASRCHTALFIPCN